MHSFIFFLNTVKKREIKVILWIAEEARHSLGYYNNKTQHQPFQAYVEMSIFHFLDKSQTYKPKSKISLCKKAKTIQLEASIQWRIFYLCIYHFLFCCVNLSRAVYGNNLWVMKRITRLYAWNKYLHIWSTYLCLYICMAWIWMNKMEAKQASWLKEEKLLDWNEDKSGREKRRERGR